MMSPAEEGAYIRLLCFDWSNDGIPDDDEALARLSRLGEGWLKGGCQMVKPCFNQHPSKQRFLTNSRIQEERERQRLWAEKSSRGGQKSSDARKSNQSSTKRQPKLKGGSTMVDVWLQPKGNTSSSSSSSKDCTFDKSKVLPTFSIPQIPDKQQAVKNSVPIPVEERSPLATNCHHFRATTEQLAQAKKTWQASGNKPDDFEAAIREVDLWLQGETAGALKARKSKAHTRHIHAAWVLDNLAQRKKANGKSQPKNLSRKERETEFLQNFIAELEEQEQQPINVTPGE